MKGGAQSTVPSGAVGAFFLDGSELSRQSKGYATLFLHTNLDRMTYDCGVDDIEATLR